MMTMTLSLYVNRILAGKTVGWKRKMRRMSFCCFSVVVVVGVDVDGAVVVVMQVAENVDAGVEDGGRIAVRVGFVVRAGLMRSVAVVA